LDSTAVYLVTRTAGFDSGKKDSYRSISPDLGIQPTQPKMTRIAVILWFSFLAILFPVTISFATIGTAIRPHACRPDATMMTTTTTRRNLFDFLKPNEPEDKPASKEEADKGSQAPSDDPVDKIFSFFFGEKEETPMGMKRFGRGESWIGHIIVYTRLMFLLLYRCFECRG